LISDYNHQGVDRPLSRIQLEMVALVANGYRPAEIAEIVHRSESSVEKTLRTAKTQHWCQDDGSPGVTGDLYRRAGVATG
jgi:transposase